MASTSDVATALDVAQYDADEGPCLTAAHDIASSLSVPMLLPGPDTFGGLNCYGEAPFDDDAPRLAQSFAAQASSVVSNALAYWNAFEQSRNLTIAMESRAKIEQAKGILMAMQKCTADEAFDLLRRASQR